MSQALGSDRGDEIVKASLPFLKADSPVLMKGAVGAVRQFRSSDPAVREALFQAAEHVVSRGEPELGNEFTQLLAMQKDERAHALLRSLVERGFIQVSNALVSFEDPADLPRLSVFLSAREEATSESDQRTAFLPYELYSAYGAASVPYLRTALKAPLGRFTLSSAATRLIAADDPAGFQFAAQAIEQNRVSRSDMIQALKSRFPELKAANDDAVLAFARERAGSAK